MTAEQLSAFPMTRLEVAEAFLRHFDGEVEKRTRAMLSAQDKLAEALKLRAMAEEEVRRQRDGDPVGAAIAAMKEGAEAAGLGVTLVAGDEEIVVCEPPDADPLTGEVAPPATGGVVDNAALTVDLDTGEVTEAPDPWTCPACKGDGRPFCRDGSRNGNARCPACDGTGHQAPSCDNCTAYGDCNISQPKGSATMGCGGRSWIHGEYMAGGEIVPSATVTGEVASDVVEKAATGENGGKNLADNVTPCVVVLYPGDDEPHVTVVGPYTRYSELVADYIAEHNEEDLLTTVISDYAVVREDELTTDDDDDGHRDLSAVIRSEDHGRRLIVAAADQGSVCGVEVTA